MRPELNRIYQGDCREVLAGWPENSIDAIVTDPPYGIRFMGKAWDGADIDRAIEQKKRKKTARPGGRQISAEPAMAAGTYDLTPEAMKNFQEWTREWAVQALRVLKPGGHLLSFASPRTYHRMTCGIEDAGFEIRDQIQWLYGSGFPKSLNVAIAIAKKFNPKWETGDPYPLEASTHMGKGTALTPANEPICLARKPLSEPTVAANVLKWGTGALNIDASRIEATDFQLAEKYASVQKAPARDNNIYGKDSRTREGSKPHVSGRFPSNVILDEEAGKILDGQSGVRAPGGWPKRRSGLGYGSGAQGTESKERIESNRGGASRFFYCAKASKEERGLGNNHPTVKPIALIQYLISLVLPPGGIVLDPFLGSGTTMKASRNMGVDCLGVELDPQYVKIGDDRRNGELFR